MQAARLIRVGAALEGAEIPDLEPEPGEVVVRVEASGICYSDAHYRAGDPSPRVLPVTPGYEVAGVITAMGPGVASDRRGERVAVHYVVSCGACDECRRFGEQFCETYEMFGLTRDGGCAELLAVPARNAVPIPSGIRTEHAALMMCSSATSLHALRKGRLQEGESVAVFGTGGLGMSAIQLALALGASRVFAVDIDDSQLKLAASFGATPLQGHGDPAAAVRKGGGVDVALTLVGNRDVFSSAMASLKPRGRLVAVGIVREPVAVVPFRDLIVGEHELIGSNDHWLNEIHDLVDFATRGLLRLDEVVTARIPLEPDTVNQELDRLDVFGPGIRTVITP